MLGSRTAATANGRRRLGDLQTLEELEGGLSCGDQVADGAQERGQHGGDVHWAMPGKPGALVSLADR